MPQTSDETLHIIRRTLLWLFWIAIVFLFFWFAWEVAFLAFAGLLLAIILDALTNWVQRRTRLGRSLSFTIVCCGVLVVLVLIGWFIVPRVITQTAQIVQIIPKSITAAKNYLDRFRWGPHVVDLVTRAMMNFNFAGKLTAIVSGVADGIAALIIVAVVGFYGAANSTLYLDGIVHLVPARHREKTRNVGAEVLYTLHWWILGQLVPMIVLGIATMIGLWAMGVPLAFTLGLFTGVMIFIPYLGALLSEIPAVLVALSVSPRTALYVIVFYLGVHILEGYVLTPLVQKRAVRLLPIVTILVQFFMWIITGLLGVAIATPMAAAAWVLIKRLYLHEKISHHQGFGA